MRITSLATLIDGADAQKRDEQWSGLASLAVSIIRWADRTGIYEPFDHVLDAPFYALRADAAAVLERTLDCIEAYLGYWLSISPPLHYIGVPAELLEQEHTLLHELRGARFIRLLSHLPKHYQRFGFMIDEALAGPPPGATRSEQNALLRFDPFDQRLAERNLREARERLLRDADLCVLRASGTDLFIEPGECPTSGRTPIRSLSRPDAKSSPPQSSVLTIAARTIE